jgi:spermidine/putrescine transport system ATP-binding protein
MHDGRVEQIGTPAEIYEEPVSLRVARFVGDTNIFDAVILGKSPDCPDGSLEARVEGQEKPCLLKTRKEFAAGQNVKVVLRPEDLLVNRKQPGEKSGLMLGGVVDELIYKGSTYDIVISLQSGNKLVVTEFFDEDDESMIASVGDAVYVSWIKGWEVVLPDEGPEPV